MSRLAVDRLWPMLAALGALLFGALLLEQYAERRGNEVIRIAIADEGAGLGDDEEGEDPEERAEEAPAVSDLHARARREALRARFAEAIPLYEKTLAAHPGSPAVEGEMGAVLTAAGEPERALAHLERADRLAPGPQSALRLGRARARLREWAGAEREYRRALELKPSYGSARIALGSFLRRRGRTGEAIAVLEPAAASGSNEERARALVALGTAWLGAGRRADAEKALDAAILYAPARAEIRLGVARAWLGADGPGDVGRAVQVLLRALEMAPDVPQLHSTLGRARERNGELAAAAEAYDRALRLDPSYRWARRRMYRLALQTRDFARARHDAERLVADAPEVPEHHFLEALAADRDGRTDEARRSYRKAIAVAKGVYPEAWLNLGVLEKGAGDLAAARAAYEKAIAQRPGYAAAWQNLAKLREAANDTAGAEEAYRRALELDPGYASAWLSLGQLRSAQGRTAEAIEDLKRAVAARPRHEAAQLSLGVAYARAGRTEEAIQAYRALLEHAPRYGSAWFNLGLSLQAAGRLPEAREALGRAAELDAGHAPSRRALAEIDVAEGKLDAARTRLEEVLDLAPGDLAARISLAEVAALAGDRAACEERARKLLAEAPGDPRVRALGPGCLSRSTPKEGAP